MERENIGEEDGQGMSRSSSYFYQGGEQKGTAQTPKHRQDQANFFRKGL